MTMDAHGTEYVVASDLTFADACARIPIVGPAVPDRRYWIRRA